MAWTVKLYVLAALAVAVTAQSHQLCAYTAAANGQNEYCGLSPGVASLIATSCGDLSDCPDISYIDMFNACSHHNESYACTADSQSYACIWDDSSCTMDPTSLAPACAASMSMTTVCLFASLGALDGQSLEEACSTVSLDGGLSPDAIIGMMCPTDSTCLATIQQGPPACFEDGSGTGSGEEACEGQGWDQSACLNVGCCHWNYEGGECWSNVGRDLCHGGDVGDGSGGAKQDTPTPDLTYGGKSLAVTKQTPEQQCLGLAYMALSCSQGDIDQLFDFYTCYAQMPQLEGSGMDAITATLACSTFDESRDDDSGTSPASQTSAFGGMVVVTAGCLLSYFM